MKKNRLIFYVVFGAFHLFLVFFTLYVESNRNDFSFLTQMLKWMPVMKYGAFLGLGLLIADVVWGITASRELRKENAMLTHEVNTLKAKLFDLQEAAKKSSPSANPSVKP
jgi:hypothetical protein